ncbi:hypothetical protein OS21_43240 [Dickeya oryzae]
MGLALRALQAAFKSAYADLSFTRITYLSKLIGTHSLAAVLQLELIFGIDNTSEKNNSNTKVNTLLLYIKNTDS